MKTLLLISIVVLAVGCTAAQTARAQDKAADAHTTIAPVVAAVAPFLPPPLGSIAATIVSIFGVIGMKRTYETGGANIKDMLTASKDAIKKI